MEPCSTGRTLTLVKYWFRMFSGACRRINAWKALPSYKNPQHIFEEAENVPKRTCDIGPSLLLCGVLLDGNATQNHGERSF